MFILRHSAIARLLPRNHWQPQLDMTCEVTSMSGEVLSLHFSQYDKPTVADLALKVIEHHWTHQGLEHFVNLKIADKLKKDGTLNILVTIIGGAKILNLSEPLSQEICYGFIINFLADQESALDYLHTKGPSCAIYDAPDCLRQNRNFVATCIQTSGYSWTLGFASEELRNDKDFVLMAVKKNGRALSFASDELKKDKDVILAALQQNPRALYLLPPELQESYAPLANQQIIV